jgi:cytochrome c biogenesis protein CcdA/glutaredoxin
MKFFSKIFTGLTVSALAGLMLAGSAMAAPLASESQVVANYTEEEITIYVGDGCPHCAVVEEYVEDEGVEEYLDVEFKEVYNDRGNAAEFHERATELGLPLGSLGVPFLVVGDEHFVGDKPIIAFFEEQIGLLEDDEPVVEPGGGTVDDPDGGVDGSGDGPEELSIALVVGAALADAVNPCAFAVLVILLTSILAGGNKKRALWSGLLFSLAIFISYLAMGFGLYSAIASAGISTTFMKVIAVVAIILGLFNLKDALRYGKWFKMEVPMSWRPKMKSVLQSVTSPGGAFVIGFLISLFLLPCTSGPYIVILSMLGAQETFGNAAWLLVLYNLIFVAPMLFITLAVYKGFAVEKAEEMRQKRIKALHLIAGVILVIMGIVIWFDFM